MLRRVFSPSLVLASTVALTGYFGSRIYSSISIPSELNIRSSDRIPDNFARSFAVSTVNPHHHPTVTDTRSVIVSVSNDLSHEQILARFLVGFFGGNVFAPERAALRLMRKTIVEFKGMRPGRSWRMDIDETAELGNEPISTQIWTTEEVGEARVPPLHSILFGAFRLVDITLSDSLPKSVEPPPAQYSYIDIAFGADDGFIAGVHRFSVSEDEDSIQMEGKKPVTIASDHISCNSKENKPLGPDLLQTLHLWYAMLLFREGLGHVLKAE